MFSQKDIVLIAMLFIISKRWQTANQLDRQNSGRDKVCQILETLSSSKTIDTYCIIDELEVLH
jgi:hypothetical protein